MKRKYRNSSAGQGIISGFPALIGLLCFFIMALGIHFLPSDSMTALIAVRLGLSIIIMVLIFPLFKLRYFAKPYKGWTLIFKMGKAMIGMTAFFCLLGILCIFAFKVNPQQAFDDFKPYIALGISVGICEELVFRQGIFRSFEKQFQSLKKGSLVAALLASLLFGLIHILFDISLTPMGLLTMTAKVLETGVTSMIFCAMLYKSENLWLPIFMHMILDTSAFFIYVVNPEATLGTYVFTEFSTEALMCLVAYVIEIVICLPATLYAIKILKDEI